MDYRNDDVEFRFIGKEKQVCDVELPKRLE